MKDVLVELVNVHFTYPNGVKALRGISLRVHRGERVAVLGPNGSGKSTLILMMAGLLPPNKGEARVFNADTSTKEFKRQRHRIGLVFQDPDDQLFTQSVVGDVEYGPRNLKLPDDEVKERSNHVLEMMGIAHLKDRPPYRLSFGEKKKAALATALVLKPELLILDEPTANLDLATRRGLIRILKELHDAGTTIIVSTHDAEALPELADRIVVINEGTLLGDGTLSEILQNTSLLESAGLEPPTIVILFTELHRKGLVTHVPLTIEEGLKELSKST